MARILVVDDSPDMVNILCMVVRTMGHEGLPAYGGRQALEAVATEPPDLVLLDLMMPEVDGYQVLAALRREPKTRHLPVIVVTASAELDLEDRLMAAGADGLLRKPVEPAVLASTIQATLARERAAAD